MQRISFSLIPWDPNRYPAAKTAIAARVSSVVRIGMTVIDLTGGAK
jgi:hypothetical protein